MGIYYVAAKGHRRKRVQFKKHVYDLGCGLIFGVRLHLTPFCALQNIEVADTNGENCVSVYEVESEDILYSDKLDSHFYIGLNLKTKYLYTIGLNSLCNLVKHQTDII